MSSESVRIIQQLNDSYRSILENELLQVVHDLLSVVENSLLPSVSSDESKVFYNKLCGDFCRYAAEIAQGVIGVNNNVTDNYKSQIISNEYNPKAFEHYSSAYSLAEKSLESTNPIRLGLCLNYSVYLYEIKNDQKNACDIARNTFDLAISKLDDLDEINYKQTTLQMQLIRDNLTLWTAQDQEMQ